MAAKQDKGTLAPACIVTTLPLLPIPDLIVRVWTLHHQGKGFPCLSLCKQKWRVCKVTRTAPVATRRAVPQAPPALQVPPSAPFPPSCSSFPPSSAPPVCTCSQPLPGYCLTGTRSALLVSWQDFSRSRGRRGLCGFVQGLELSLSEPVKVNAHLPPSPWEV